MNPRTRSISEALECLQQIPIFNGLKVDSLRKLADSSAFLTARKGDFIFIQSDPSEHCYVVRSGLISILLESTDGREMVINEMYAGDLFGEIGVLTNHVRSTTAVARTTSEILALSRKAFLTVIDEEPLLARRMLDVTANRLRVSSERESALAFLDAQARLARLLLQQDKLTSQKGYITISQEELAQRTGLTRQTVAKILGRWRRAGWLITGRGRILLLRHAEFAQLEREWLNG